MIQGNESIASRLTKARISRDLTRNQARLSIGYTFDTYVATETGERLPMPVELPALAIWLQCDLEQLKAQHAIERAARRAQPTTEQGAPAADSSPTGPGADGADHVGEPTSEVPA